MFMTNQEFFNRSLKIMLLILFLFDWRSVVSAETLQELMQKGDEKFQQQKYKEAIVFYEKAVGINPDFAPAYDALGDAHFFSGHKIDQVLWFYQTALQIDPHMAEAYSDMCRAYVQSSQFKPAESSCLKALTIDPNQVGAKFNLGWVYLGSGEAQKSVKYFTEVSQVLKIPLVYYGLGQAYATGGQNAMALEMITKLRDMGSSDWAIKLEQTIDLLLKQQEERKAMAEEEAGLKNGAEAHPNATFSTSVDGQLLQTQSQAPASPAADPDGQMQIRLKGKLYPLEEQ